LEKAIDIGERIFPNFRYRWLGEELRMNIPKELDFPLEISNMKAAKKMLKELKNVKVIELLQDLYRCLMFTRNIPQKA
jgi:aarF domain-containing kinase